MASGWAEGAVVKTKAILSEDVLALLVARHVFAFDDSQEGRQGAPLLEPCREQAREWRPGGSAPCAVSGGDQLLARAGVAQVDRGAGSRRRAIAELVAVCGGSLRGRAVGRVDCAAEAVAIAVEPAKAMGRVLAGAQAMGGTAARSVLGGTACSQPQGHAVGSGPVCAGGVSVDCAGGGVAIASRVVRAQRLGRFAGSRRGARGQSQTVPLPRPSAGAQAGGVRSSGGALAGSVQRLLRGAAV